MSDPPADPAASLAQRHRWLIPIAALLGIVLAVVAVFCAMVAYDQFDSTCGPGGEGGAACATRGFVVAALSIVPGLLIVTGLVLLSRGGRQKPPDPPLSPPLP
jgi:hypothetical protein